MNASVRATPSSGRAGGVHVVGLEGGYEGLIDGTNCPLTNEVAGQLVPERAVDLALDEGGTLLGSSRFIEPAGRAEDT